MCILYTVQMYNVYVYTVQVYNVYLVTPKMEINHVPTFIPGVP